MTHVSLNPTDLHHHAGKVHSTDPLTIESLPQEWAYTVSLPLAPAASVLRPPVLISIDLAVHEGSVGCLAVASDLKTLLGRVPLPAGPGEGAIQLVLERCPPDGRLVFRNHTRGGHACVFTLRSVSAAAAPPDAMGGASRLHEVSSAGALDLEKLLASVQRVGQGAFDDELVFARLREKWGTVPGGLSGRLVSSDLLSMGDDELRSLWTAAHREATTDAGFGVRGWYQALYRDVLHGKSVLEIGSGMGIDGIEFARCGARMTFVDIVETNLAVMERLCRLFGITDARFVYLENLSSLERLAGPFDAVFCQGSLINVPFDFAARECASILPHLTIGGRWIELAYPRERWERDGRPPFSIWGTMTDGEGTPWMEWYDLDKIKARLAPAQFETVLAINFHRDDFNWFDLRRTQ